MKQCWDWAMSVAQQVAVSLDWHHDTIHSRQLLCPDRFCEVCNSTTAEVNRLLFPESLEDATPSVTPLASTDPVTDSSLTSSPDFSAVCPGDLIPVPLPEPSPAPPTIFSPTPVTLLADFFLPSPPGHSLLLEAKALDSEIPVSHSIPQPLAFPALLLQDTQKGDPVVQREATLPLITVSTLDPTISQDFNLLPNLSQIRNPTDSFACHHAPPTWSVSPQPDCTLTVTQSKSISISMKPDPEKSSPDSPGGLSTYVPRIRGSDCSSPSISEFSCWQVHAKNMCLPTLAHSDFQQEQVYLHLPETYLWRDSATKHKEASGISFPGLNFQAPLESQMKKRMAFQILEKKVKEEGPFSKQMWSEYQWTSEGNLLQPFDVQVTTAPKTGWNIEGKPERLRIYQQLLNVKSLGENLHQKYSQLFWGLPSLHSESLVATLLFSNSTSPVESHFVLFNGIHNTSVVKMQDQAFPPLPHSYHLPLPSVHPQPLSQTLSQSQPLPFTQVNTQAHFQSHLPIIPSSSSQIRDCGMSFHRSKNESDSHILTKNQHLEWHVLQKQQESLWGLVPVFQKSQETICPRAPNLPLVSQSSHAHVPVSILPGHFHITCEPQETLELPSPRKVIPRWCLHDCRNLESLVLMEPQCKLIEISHQRGRHVHSQLSEFRGHSSKDLAKTELNLPGSFHERVPTKFQLRKDMRRNLGYILEKSPEDSPQRVSECYLVKGRRAALETTSNCVCHSRNHSENELLNVSRKETDQNQIKSILRLHMSKKFWQITAGRIPIGVCYSWLADDNTLPFSRSSQTTSKNTNSKKTMVGRVNCQVTTLELSFLDPKTRQVLEAHIIRFRMSQRWGLPLRVLESIKFYMLREAKTWPLPQVDFPSSAMHISGVNSKAEFFKLLDGSSKTFLGNRVRTANSVPTLDHPLPTMLSVGNAGQGVLKASHSHNDHKPAECIQIAECGSQTFQGLTHSIRAQVRPSETVPENTCGPEVPTRQAAAGQEPRHENVDSSNRVEVVQGKVMVEKNLEHFAMSNLSTDIFDTEELCTLQSQSCDTLTTSELGSSKMINVSMSKVEIALTTEHPSPKILVSQDSKLSGLKRQLLSKLKFKLEREEHNQAQRCPTDMPLTSDSLTSKASLTPSQSVCSGDMEASQVLHVQLEDSRISTGQQQESWDSKLAFCKCRTKNFPQRKSERKVRPQDSKARKCRSEDSGVGTSVGRKESYRVEDRKLERASPSRSQNEQFPPESYFRKKMRHFFQWINSKKKITGQQESPQQKAKFMSTLVQHQDPVQSVTTFVSDGPPEAHKLMTTTGKVLEEKLACRYGSEASALSQQQEELQAQVGPDKRYSSNYWALSDPQQKKRASIKSCSQEAVCADQNRLRSVRQNRHRVRHPRKVVAFEDQVLSQSQPPSSLPSGEPVPHPSPTCVHQVCQVLSATRGDPGESTVFSDLTLLLKQKMLPQHFHREKFP
ncbi:spermatogenesis-associated protein 31D1-like [Phoca vitulina]|uniref:spermatogenesis-associated protein 31D1-like n=1 Tax=Phoca vitulina TaxID=9720 RepID=UPI0013960685|nr:spermatogenesis-associated protein 31D1-like [Phoca vitulina]